MMKSASEAHRGWEAELCLGYAQRAERSALVERRHKGPLTVQRPFYPEGPEVCHTYLLHPPAGIVGGDRLSVNVNMKKGTHALLTTPGANRWYYSPDRRAQVYQTAELENDAILEWLPQETLVFDGAQAQLKTRIALGPKAQFCGWEILGLGRPACGERFTHGMVDFRFEIYREGRPLFIDRWAGQGDSLPGLRGYGAYATLCATVEDDQILGQTRERLATMSDGIAGATVVNKLLVVRALAPRCQPIVSMFWKLWEELRPHLLGRVAEVPRIWYT